ncbi:MAG: hypothetical protein K6F51_13025 [Acetatifactor sp.]|nr:hypothetical protein [Acetatifactor sp.]
MGFLDKLFGSNVADKLKNAAETVAKEATNAVNAAVNSSSAATNARSASTAPAPSSSGAESGFSWGPTMPNEENQFNYPGTYDQYFLDVYSKNFPAYRLTTEPVRKGSATVITFWSGEAKALVVELMSDTSSAESIRRNCYKERVPYLRFYYNHQGWWNTKAYVLERTSKALNQ